MTVNDKINSFNQFNILIIGDVMLDVYLHGEINRNSPEAPISVVDVKSKEYKLGGASNVALNLKALGANPFLCSIIGNDSNGLKTIELLESNGIIQKGIIITNDRPTTTKTRVLSNNKQIVRIDDEVTDYFEEKIYQLLYDKVITIINQNEIHGVIFEDYDKGVLAPLWIEKIIEFTNNKNITTFADPKFKQFWNYQHVDFFKPNLKELKEAIGTSAKNLTIKVMLEILQKKLKNRITFVTLSEDGIMVLEKDFYHHGRALMIDVIDVTGAGDTVIALATLCVLSNINLETTVVLCNLAGAKVCQNIGSYALLKDELINLYNSQ